MKLTAALLLIVTTLRQTDGQLNNSKVNIFTNKYLGTIFGIRIRDAPQQSRPSYKPQYKPNLFDSVAGLKAGALRSGANALRFKVKYLLNVGCH